MRASGVSGFGEAACRADPYYSHEYVDAALLTLRSFVFRELGSDGWCRELLRRTGRVRGWPFTRAAVIDALIDLAWRATGTDLIRNARPDQPLPAIPAGISLGIENDLERVSDAIQSAMASGYQRVKLKIDTHVDPRLLWDVRSRFPELSLGFDANASLDIRRDRRLLEGLALISPAFVEEPFAVRDFESSAWARTELGLRVCLDESIETTSDVSTASRFGAVDEINLKIGRVGGAAAAFRIAELCKKSGIPIWMGGMFETGVGRAAALRLASVVRPDAPSDLGPSARYYHTDIVDPPIEMTPNGLTIVPMSPVNVDLTNADRWERINLGD